MNHIRIGIIYSTYYDDYHKMLDAALTEIEKQSVLASIVSPVPGCYDMPLLAKIIVQKDYIDAVICLGVVLPIPYVSTGAAPDDEITSWDETLANNVLAHLDRLSIEYGKPVVKEIIGPGFPVGMVEEQMAEYAVAGVRAAIQLVKEVRRLSAL
ncbi:MAG TPA: 6,7-dimethyl-8-ribityllumazine synthase [Spirochaetia bacterium]|nr:6,7-dimethyl-8-ribityllumazine synthase [Spirochaetia bacterium]